ncbi:MAG: glycosyltransferase [Desulfobacteraceae bacterium]|nr:glycosyltransferase [Desulfobacteraceae bacterium]
MISVIIPAYNAEKTIAACLESLIRQSLPVTAYEVIVVDDGSSDATAQIIQRFPVTLIRQKNQGPAAARNAGAEAARGDIIVFTDSDCELEELFLFNITRPFADPAIAGVQGRYQTRQKSLTARFCQYEIEERYEIYQRSRYITMIGTYAAAFRRQIFLDNGKFDTRFPIASGEDFAFSGRLAAQGYKLVFVPDAVCFHRHPETVKKYFRQKYFRAYWRNLLYKLNSKAILQDRYTPQILKLQTLFLLVSPLFVFFLVILGLRSGYELPSALLALWMLFFTASTLPLGRLTWKHSPSVALWVPLFALIRAAALSSGLVHGFWSQNVIDRIKNVRNHVFSKPRYEN